MLTEEGMERQREEKGEIDTERRMHLPNEREAIVRAIGKRSNQKKCSEGVRLRRASAGEGRSRREG